MVQVGSLGITSVQDTTNWDVIMAMPPLAVVFVLVQEQFTPGFALGKEK